MKPILFGLCLWFAISPASGSSVSDLETALLPSEVSLGEVTFVGDCNLRIELLPAKSSTGISLCLIHNGPRPGSTAGATSTWALAWFCSRLFSEAGVPFHWITPTGIPADPVGHGSFRYAGRKWRGFITKSGLVRLSSGSLWCDYDRGLLVSAGFGAETSFTISRTTGADILLDSAGKETVRILHDPHGRPAAVLGSAPEPIALRYGTSGLLESVWRGKQLVALVEYAGTFCRRLWQRNGNETVLAWTRIDYDAFRASPYWYVSEKDGWSFRTSRTKTLFYLERQRGTTIEILEYDMFNGASRSLVYPPTIGWRTWPAPARTATERH